MIEVSNLVKNYGPVPAVKGISFTMEKGHVYGFLGPNGAGKSTTMNMLCGCLAATSGTAVIEGHDIFEDAVEAKRHIGYLPELPPLYTDMTPFEYLEFVGRAKRIPKTELYNCIEDVMKRAGITDVADRLIKNLSKGYRQRVGIAQAILGDPDVIVLDEPTVGLDPIQIMEVRDLIRELGREHTVILSSHILQEISAVCDHVIMISRGTIVASDTIENLVAQGSGLCTTRIETTGDEETVRNVLSGVGGIHSLSFDTKDGHLVAVIETEKGSDVGDSIFLAFRKASLPVHSMTENQSSLEDVFVRLAGESLDAGAAYASEKSSKPAKPPKGAKKVIGESDLGPAYYTETYEFDADEDADEDAGNAAENVPEDDKGGADKEGEEK